MEARPQEDPPGDPLQSRSADPRGAHPDLDEQDARAPADPGPPLVSTGISERSAEAPVIIAESPPNDSEGDPTGQDRLPGYVQRCAATAPSEGPGAPWILRTWRRGEDPSKGSRGLARCGSWRCEACRRWKASQDFARIAAAFEPCPPSELVFAVVTLDQLGTTRDVPWSDPADAHPLLSSMTRGLLARLRRRYGGDPGSRWVMVVEAHASGWPHANLLMHAPQLAAELETDDDHLVVGELRELVTRAGWGRTTMERVRDDGRAVAGYLVKVATRETAKVMQLPLNASKNFRRLRSGRGFLPPVQKDPTITGAMLERRDGCVRIIGGRETPHPELQEGVVSELELVLTSEAEVEVLGEARAGRNGRAPR